MYKVVVVSEQQANCCTNQKEVHIDKAIETEANRWSSQGFALISAYPQQVAKCGNTSSVGAVLIFAKRP